MKFICDHSLEEKTTGKQCILEFMSTNMKLIQVSKEYDNCFFRGTNTMKKGRSCSARGAP